MPKTESLAQDKTHKGKRVKTSVKDKISSTTKKSDNDPFDDIFNELDNLVEEIKKDEERMSQVQNQKQIIVEEKTSASTRKSRSKEPIVEQKKIEKGRVKVKKDAQEVYQHEDSDFELSKQKKPKSSVPKPKNKKITDNVSTDIPTVNAKGKKAKNAKTNDASTINDTTHKENKKITENVEDNVFEYLKSTNRPYSLINIFDNLKGKVKKPVLQQLLDNLAEKQLIDKKDFNKMTVYYYNQRSIAVDQQIIAESKQGLENVKGEYTEATTFNKELKVKLNIVEKEETTNNIKTLVNSLNQEIPALQNKLNMFKDKGVELIPEHVVDEKMKSIEIVDGIMKKRRRIFKTMFDTIQEQSGQKTEELCEMLGIELLQSSKY